MLLRLFLCVQNIQLCGHLHFVQRVATEHDMDMYSAAVFDNVCCGLDDPKAFFIHLNRRKRAKLGVPIRLEAKSLRLELVPKLPSDGAHLSIGGVYLNQMPFRLIVGGAKEH